MEDGKVRGEERDESARGIGENGGDDTIREIHKLVGKKDEKEGGKVNHRRGHGDLKRAVKPSFSIIHSEINTTPVRQR